MLITILPIVMIGFAAMPLLQPEVYTTSFEKFGIYDKLPIVPAGYEEIFTKDFVKENVNRIVVSGLAYIRGETNELDLSIPIDRNQIRAVVLQQINSIPECPTGVVPQNPQSPECLPKGYNRAQLADSALNSINIPDKIDLLQAQPQIKQGIDQVKDKVVFLYKILYALLALSVILILLIILLTRHSLKSMLKWLGSALLLSGITVLAISFILTNLVISMIRAQLGSSGIAISLISSILDVFAGSMRLYAAIITIIGAAMYLAAWKMKAAKK
ncbi:MAG: hypothetical protein QMD97_01625 [Candidatus Aenigmarchaeota archaeon]|nr:hypothetical protein [Candidatus Aenigmarchaeota archaeon]